MRSFLVAATLLLGFVPFASRAQANTEYSGSFLAHSSDGSPDSAMFTCFGTPTCTGRFSEKLRDVRCSNSFALAGDFRITGLNLTVPSAMAEGEKATLPLALVVTVDTVAVTSHPDGTCTYTITAPAPLAFNGTWDGTTGRAQYGGGAYSIDLTFKATAARSTPPLSVGVNGSLSSSTTVAQATVLPRSQDVNTLQSVYVFARAPTAVVHGASVEKDTPVQCVLAQLNASGQLQTVTASSMQAYVTGVLSAQGQAVSVLNGVPTVNIAGATFFIGYGSSASSMLNGNTNQPVIRVPGVPQCDPQPPQTGWWWNANEGGRGYSIEVAGSTIFFASYLYDVSGRATWLIAEGTTQLDGSLFTGNLEAYANGQTLGGAYRPYSAAGIPGLITLAFSDATTGTMIWPGGTVAIERFEIVPHGLTLVAPSNQPQAGWWWNKDESGRGFFLEWQGGQLLLAGYMYDSQGNPIWYLAQDVTPDSTPLSFNGTWWQYGNGPTLTGAYRPPNQVNNNVAPVTITFSGSENAIMTLPNGRSTALTRFRF